jgi:hypothetical protein
MTQASSEARTEQAEDRPSSRRGFLRSSTLAGLMAAPIVGVLTASASAAGRNYEEDTARRRNQIARMFRSIQGHENAHVAFLTSALGAAARPKPTFQNLVQKDFKTFAAVSQALENTGVGAYLGAAPALLNKDLLAAAGSIATVEARHAGYLNDLNGDPLTAAPQNSGTDPAFDSPLTPAQVRAAAGGFIKSLNGGPAIDYSTTPSTSNDTTILNFALALEYLEAEFYNINVRKFFGR